ncbi:MAG TPA: peptide chain release factor 1 [Candidatus Omnitrophota bacterium]|nr:peptide chain release factor 1 [Candidatus Omnitrophota bacterium]
MRQRLLRTEERFQEVERLLGTAEVLKDKNRFRDLAKELAALRPVVDAYANLRRVETELEETERLLREMKDDAELIRLYEEERETLGARKVELEQKLEALILQGEYSGLDRNVIVEIRAGTGGEEAALFAGDLFRLYSKFCARHGLRFEVLSTNQTGLGGLKEIIFSVSGSGAYRLFRFESGTHRVQRVPVTEAGGRIHTSAATVAVLPEPEEVETEIDPKDLRIDVFRASGPGGQGVNTTDSAVRITHVPTGLVVSCQDERSQLKNKAKGLRILRARLSDKMQSEQAEAISKQRRSQVGSGDRSEKIRTYNFPDRRATDHRIGVTLYELDRVMEGEIDDFVNALEKEERARLLSQEGASSEAKGK